MQPVAVYCYWNGESRYVGVDDGLKVHEGGPCGSHGVSGSRHVAHEVEGGTDVARCQLDVNFYRRRRLHFGFELFNLKDEKLIKIYI